MKNKFTIFLVLLLALTLGIQPTLAKKPLTTITFDEVPVQQPVTSLYSNGVTFEFPYYGPLGAQIVDASTQVDGRNITNMQGNCFEANARGDLTIIFDKPTTVIEFDFAIAVDFGTFVDLYQPGSGKLRETLMIPTTEIDWHEGHFTYHGSAISKAVIHFAEYYGTDFWFDTLVFHG